MHSHNIAHKNEYLLYFKQKWKCCPWQITIYYGNFRGWQKHFVSHYYFLSYSNKNTWQYRADNAKYQKQTIMIKSHKQCLALLYKSRKRLMSCMFCSFIKTAHIIKQCLQTKHFVWFLLWENIDSTINKETKG